MLVILKKIGTVVKTLFSRKKLNAHFEVPYMAKHNKDNRTTLPNFPNDCYNLLDNLT